MVAVVHDRARVSLAPCFGGIVVGAKGTVDTRGLEAVCDLFESHHDLLPPDVSAWPVADTMGAMLWEPSGLTCSTPLWSEMRSVLTPSSVSAWRVFSLRLSTFMETI